MLRSSFVPALSIVIASNVFVVQERAAAQESPLRALTAIIGADYLSTQVVRTCQAARTTNFGEVRATHQAWRTTYQVDRISSQMASFQNAQQRATLVAQAQRAADNEVDRFGSAQGACAHYIERWRGADLDMRRLHPAAYDADGQPRTLSAALQGERDALRQADLRARAVRRPDPDEPGGQPLPQPARPEGTVYTVAQLYTLGHAWYRGGSPASLDATGRIYLRGVVTRHGDSYALKHADSAYRSTMSVGLSSALSEYVGRTVVVGGFMERMPPGTVAYLSTSRVVSDPSALVASRLSNGGAVSQRGGSASRGGTPVMSPGGSGWSPWNDPSNWQYSPWHNMP